ncbi:hypothetical protein AB204_10690 [Xenorhabdus khoisanae]|uniref:Phage tail fibre adhesin Gp38 N-terminal domain-containing protein n=1 Tax=Xenorhabdus khoisanae TaxID=880157 RepID=A0A0J5FS69_9GAMM|nr:hypothetical protein [Xenorhabdus khoisanae]KMJ45153.1 hypothetical protein AB204_10690 [Xenorhabdus khoisanae]
MAINGGYVGSEVVKETGLRSILQAGAKLGLKPTFKMSDFIGKAQGFKLTFGHAEWDDEYNYDEFTVAGSGVVLDTSVESQVASFRKFGSSASGDVFFESMKLAQLYFYEYVYDDWGDFAVLIFKPHNIERDLTVTIDGVSQLFKSVRGHHTAFSVSQPFIAKLKSGQTCMVSIK